MSKRIVLGVVITLVVTVATCELWASQSRSALARSRASISSTIAEHLPLGSSVRDVTRFLDESRVQYSATGGTKPGVVAIMRWTNCGFFCSVGIQARFNFDRRERLVSYRLVDIYSAM